MAPDPDCDSDHKKLCAEERNGLDLMSVIGRKSATAFCFCGFLDLAHFRHTQGVTVSVVSALIQCWPCEKQDEEAGPNQYQHYVMVQVVARGTRPPARGERSHA